MPRVLPIAALVAGVMIPAPAISQAPATPVGVSVVPPGIDRTSQTEDVKFRSDANQRMTVRVMVGGAGPYRFVIDTGADRTVVSSEMAAALKFQSAGTAPLHSIAGVSPVATATVPTLQVTRKVVRNIVAPLLGSANIGADGILGVDALRSQRIDLDFKKQTMTVVPSISSADYNSEPNSIVIEGHRRNGRLVITEASIHGVPVTVVLDTGSEVTIGNEALRAALFRGRQPPIFQRVQLQAVTGETLSGDSAPVDRLEIGGATLGNLDVIFTSAHIFSQLKLDRRPAVLLGMDAMRAFPKVSIDFAAQKLRVVMPQHSALEYRLASLL